MPGRDRLPFTDLKALVFPPLYDAAFGWFPGRTVEKLVASPDLADLALGLEEVARKAVVGRGIRVVRAEVRRPSAAAWNRKTSVLKDTLEQVGQAETELERQQRLSQMKELLEEQQILQEETKLAHFQRRAELYERLRQAAGVLPGGL